MNIVIPMAGNGQRFADAGYALPKPFIFLKGKPLIRHVVENLVEISGNTIDKVILVARAQHVKSFGLREMLQGLECEVSIVELENSTEGAALTVLHGVNKIDDKKRPFVIANSDQLIIDSYCLSDGYFHFLGSNAGSWCFLNDNPKWSYCEYVDGKVKEVYEKKTVGCLANTGVYWWRSASDYIKCTEAMISKNIRVNGEFYVAPVMNEAIAAGGTVQVYMVNKMVGLGTPEDFEAYANH